ncbi:MAG: carboxypeptidase-like regulatory domain-containing protein, partial [Candidatus Symbiothrix sp.]|nr:carboxypeptidase-like regulatory domain-containing protein [Candidatus Symbiothrix sp.]
MKKFSLLILGVLFSWSLKAQEGNFITGGVYDKATGKPLVSASVYYAQNQKATITNAEGEFLIEKPADADSLVIAYVGYA